MEENRSREKTQSTLFIVIISSIVSGILFGSLGYYVGNLQKRSTASIVSQTGQPSSQSTAQKTYTNARVGYSLVVPSNWTAITDRSYTEPVSSMVASFIPGSRGTEVSKYVFASSPDLAACNDAGPDFDNCVNSISTDGAYVDISVDYRSEKTIDEVLAADTKVFSTWPTTLTSPISTKKTYLLQIASSCGACLWDKTYMFNGKNNYTYQIHEIVIHSGKGVLTQGGQHVVDDYTKLLENIRQSLVIE